jgi:isocitrate dehydrogenase kinase/phosphatase
MDGSSHDSAVHALAGRAAATIFTAFADYNDSFRKITQRAQRRFEMREWQLGQRDAVERIELYDHRVERCLAGLVGMLGRHIAEEATWNAARAEFSLLTAERPDRQFYATFFNSLTRKVFATIGVNPAVEFVAEVDDAQQGAAPVVEVSLQDGLVQSLEVLLAGLPWAAQLHDAPRSAQFIAGEINAVLAVRGLASQLARIEVLEPVFYRATRAYVVGRISAEGWIFPLVIALAHPESGIVADTVMISDYELRPLFGFSRSYFHVDLVAVEPVVRYLCSIMPGKPVDELYAVLGRAKQGKTERYRRLFRHLAASSDSFVHAEGVPGMVMIVFTLNSSDLVFKVIRDHFAFPKTTSRAEVMEKYRFVFRHDRVGRLVDAQEFRRLRFPRERFAPELLAELLNSAANSCRLDGDDLIIDLCYLERRLKPLDVYLREAEPAAARRAIRDYGQAIRDLALSNVFPGDLLLKNFGVSRHGRVIFYDYDELCLVTECRFRDLPAARDYDEEMRAEPWFYVGPDDVFPAQFIEFLGLRGELRAEFLQYHAALLDADYWRRLKSAHAAEAHLEVVPYQRRQISHILATP